MVVVSLLYVLFSSVKEDSAWTVSVLSFISSCLTSNHKKITGCQNDHKTAHASPFCLPNVTHYRPNKHHGKHLLQSTQVILWESKNRGVWTEKDVLSWTWKTGNYLCGWIDSERLCCLLQMGKLKVDQRRIREDGKSELGKNLTFNFTKL